jgi:hypothetical protein
MMFIFRCHGHGSRRHLVCGYIHAAMMFIFRCHGHGSRRHLVSGAERVTL